MGKRCLLLSLALALTVLSLVLPSPALALEGCCDGLGNLCESMCLCGGVQVCTANPCRVSCHCQPCEQVPPGWF